MQNEPTMEETARKLKAARARAEAAKRAVTAARDEEAAAGTALGIAEENFACAADRFVDSIK